jgi:hypothetical protein
MPNSVAATSARTAPRSAGQRLRVLSSCVGSGSCTSCSTAPGGCRHDFRAAGGDHRHGRKRLADDDRALCVAESAETIHELDANGIFLLGDPHIIGVTF